MPGFEKCKLAQRERPAGRPKVGQRKEMKPLIAVVLSRLVVVVVVVDVILVVVVVVVGVLVLVVVVVVDVAVESRHEVKRRRLPFFQSKQQKGSLNKNCSRGYSAKGRFGGSRRLKAKGRSLIFIFCREKKSGSNQWNEHHLHIVTSVSVTSLADFSNSWQLLGGKP